MDKEKRIRELVEILNRATNAYYSDEEIMSNFEYDKLEEELTQLEKETGIVLKNSPTLNVGAKENSRRIKVKHETAALSLSKTKDIDLFVNKFEEGISDAFEKGYDHSEYALLMWKADGGTLVATYYEGKLVQLVTRGDGEIGSDVTDNAQYIEGLPMTIPFTGKLVVRGEALMSYSEFARVVELTPKKNARNLANATVLSDNGDIKNRQIVFKAFKLVSCSVTPPNIFSKQFELLESFGFKVIEHEVVHISKLKERMKDWERKVPEYDFPVDGLVCALEDTMYAGTLAPTNKAPNPMVGYAFKWADETAESTIRDIVWSASRTGLLNPVVVFDPVELEGTTVERASVHNVSYIKEKDLRIGDKVTVYKANKIIPQIGENLSSKDGGEVRGKLLIPCTCPVCGGVAKVEVSEAQNEVLVCIDPSCSAKKIGKYAYFCGRDCMNIMDMSEKKIGRFVNEGFIKEYSDFFHLHRYKDEIIALDGFGEKSYTNIIKAVEKARETDFVHFINALGIPNVGKGQAKLLKKHFEHIKNGKILSTLELFHNSTRESLSEIDGIGEVISNNIAEWLNENYKQMQSEYLSLLNEVTITDDFDVESSKGNNPLSGLTFVITGELDIFKNRTELQSKIEELGGKTTGSVTGKTSYLICNKDSGSGKSKKAKELNVPVITESEFVEKFMHR